MNFLKENDGKYSFKRILGFLLVLFFMGLGVWIIGFKSELVKEYLYSITGLIIALTVGTVAEKFKPGNSTHTTINNGENIIDEVAEKINDNARLNGVSDGL